jgi:beta-carotene 3-hydroxylase
VHFCTGCSGTVRCGFCTSRTTKRRLEANDVLSSAHAPIACALIVYGSNWAQAAQMAAFGVGVGMTLYGALYLCVHDGFIHGRLPFAWLSNFEYFRRVRRAHQMHHQVGKAPGSYGLFLTPLIRKRPRQPE